MPSAHDLLIVVIVRGSSSHSLTLAGKSKSKKQKADLLDALWAVW